MYVELCSQMAFVLQPSASLRGANECYITICPSSNAKFTQKHVSVWRRVGEGRCMSAIDVVHSGCAVCVGQETAVV